MTVRSTPHILSIVAVEECRPEEIEEVLHWMRRLVKPTKSQIEAALKDLSEEALAIALRELEFEKLPSRPVNYIPPMGGGLPGNVVQRRWISRGT